MFRLSNKSMTAPLLALAALTSCGGQSDRSKHDSAQPAIALSSADTGSNVPAAPGQDIDVTLSTIGPGEYSTPSISSDSVQFLGVITPAAQNPGGPTQEFQFGVERPGTAVITIPHTVKSTPFSVTITVP